VSDGTALVIDESYNANPASMRATLSVLAAEEGRKLAVLGEMRELGEKSDGYHADLAAPVRDAGVEAVILVGESMTPLAAALEGQMEVMHVTDAATARDRLNAVLRAGDAVLIKGSNGVGLSAVVAALRGGKV
jgi:UDP-N-acetylmuramoyl-tripeptide--D-alanyl-D-alanine ligase